MSNLTLGSLFDGSGGFPLGAILNGITPIWASEVEPFPIRVTTKRLPQVKHLGDICKINGAEIEPVDIITFGSPCQNLSLAGKRAGLDGEKSSLFYEAIRVIKEMRDATNGKYPRFIVWENVPGAFSSAQGNDFRCVLEEIIKIKDETFSIPLPKDGKWLCAGEIVASGVSVAWRTLDAQFWGVAQRRRRIYLVADFAGECAGKILFESEGVSWHPSQSQIEGQGTAGDAEKGSGKTIGFEPGAMSRLGGHHSVEQICTLRAQMGDNQACVAVMGERQHGLPISENVAHCLLGTDYKGSQCVFENHSQDTRYVGPLDVAQTVLATYGTGGNNQPFVVSDTPKTLKIRSGCESGGKGALVQENKSATLSCNNEQTVFVPTVFDAKQVTSKTNRSNPKQGSPCHTLASGNADSAVICYGICSDKSNSMLSDNPNSGIYEADTSRTLDQGCGNPSCNQGGLCIVEQNDDVFCINQGGRKSNCSISENLSPTITCTHGGEPAICIQSTIIGRAYKNGPNGSGINQDISFTLDTTNPHAVVYALDCASYNQGQNAQFDISISDDGTAQTVVAKGPGAVASFYPQMKAESQCYREDGTANTIAEEIVLQEFVLIPR